jgi:hypothetical protein
VLSWIVAVMCIDSQRWMACLFVVLARDIHRWTIKGCHYVGTECVSHIQPLLQSTFALTLLLPLYALALRVFALYDMDDPRMVCFLLVSMLRLAGVRAGGGGISHLSTLCRFCLYVSNILWIRQGMILNTM